jgi:hypothetical protein
MTAPLMPKATALWLIENTSLTFDQIADFCQLHSLEVQAIADGDASVSSFGFDPIAHGQVTQEDIAKCSADSTLRLTLIMHADIQAKKKGAKYTPMARRQDRPDAIAWLIKNCPELSMAQIAALVGTTKNTIQSVQEKSHWNAVNIKPRNPVTLGICTQKDLDSALEKGQKARPNLRLDPSTSEQ